MILPPFVLRSFKVTARGAGAYRSVVPDEVRLTCRRDDCPYSYALLSPRWGLDSPRSSEVLAFLLNHLGAHANDDRLARPCVRGERCPACHRHAREMVRILLFPGTRVVGGLVCEVCAEQAIELAPRCAVFPWDDGDRHVGRVRPVELREDLEACADCDDGESVTLRFEVAAPMWLTTLKWESNDSAAWFDCENLWVGTEDLIGRRAKYDAGDEDVEEDDGPVGLVDVLCRRIFMLPLSAGDVVRLQLRSRRALRRARTRVRLLGLEEATPDALPQLEEWAARLVDR